MRNVHAPQARMLGFRGEAPRLAQSKLHRRPLMTLFHPAFLSYQDSHRVAEIRDRIKAYLAAQGMIKGHAGSGSRMPAQDDFLRLSDTRANLNTTREYVTGTSSSGDSPGREESVDSDHNYHLATYQHMPTLRSYVHPFAQPLGASAYSPAPYCTTEHFMVEMRCDSPIVHPYEYPDQMYIADNIYSEESEICSYL